MKGTYVTLALDISVVESNCSRTSDEEPGHIRSGSYADSSRKLQSSIRCEGKGDVDRLNNIGNNWFAQGDTSRYCVDHSGEQCAASVCK